jgi:hypothetical protein
MNREQAAAPLGSPPSLKLRRTGRTVQIIEASQARHDMVSLDYDFRFANRGVSPESFWGCSRSRVCGTAVSRRRGIGLACYASLALRYTDGGGGTCYRRRWFLVVECQQGAGTNTRALSAVDSRIVHWGYQRRVVVDCPLVSQWF